MEIKALAFLLFIFMKGSPSFSSMKLTWFVIPKAVFNC